MADNRKIEGYWYSEHEPQYPMPVPNELTVEEANIIYKLIQDKEREARKATYRGWSVSRITGERLGSREYQTDSWKWPADLGTHYVLLHQVRPSDEFLQYIGYKL